MNKMTVPEAAKIMGVTPQFLRIGLQQGRFNFFGAAVKMKRHAYWINRDKFNEFMQGSSSSGG